MISNYTEPLQMLFHPEYYAFARSVWKNAITRTRNVALQLKATMMKDHHQQESRKISVLFWEHLVGLRDDNKYYPSSISWRSFLHICSRSCSPAIHHLIALLPFVSYFLIWEILHSMNELIDSDDLDKSRPRDMGWAIAHLRVIRYGVALESFDVLGV